MTSGQSHHRIDQMFLHYDNWAQTPEVMIAAQHRIEFHLGRVNDELFALIMLSGPDQAQPDKVRAQGPYHDMDQARAAIQAIAGILKEKGYSHQPLPPIWQVQAQGQLRSIRNTRSRHQVDSRFVPLGVPPEKP